MIGSSNKVLIRGDIFLGAVLGSLVTLVSGMAGSLGVYLGLPILGFALLALSRIWRNRLLTVFAVTITMLSVIVFGLFLIANALDGGP